MDALRRVLQQTGQLQVQSSPLEAIRQAAADTGADFDYIYRTARRESGMNASARAQTSSATGLFQFTSETWLSMIERYGDKYGVGDIDTSNEAGRDAVLAMRDDPVASARMAGELANENAAILSNLIGREATSQELYAAHFLGPSGAAKLINAAREDSTQSAVELFPRAASANASIFYGSDGSERSVAAVYARLTGDLLSDVDGAGLPKDAEAGRLTSYIAGQHNLGGVDVQYNAEEAIMNARATQTLMAALIELQTRSTSED